jgi:diguanylate cyclase (GGDEF)-like protein/PAS domain S-box-containing protein
MQEKSLRHRLMIIISCIFVLPSFVLGYIFFEQNVTLSPTHFVLCFLIMVLAISGILLVRYVFEAVSTTADFLKKATEGGEKVSLNIRQEAVEFNEISSSLNRLVDRLGETTDALNQTREVLHESEGKYRNILENIEEGYYELDLTGHLTFFNEACRRIYGYSRDELLGMNALKLADEDNAKKALKYFNEVYATGKPLSWIDGEIIRKDGSKRNVEASASLTWDLTGKPIGFRGIIRDVTELKQAEQLYKTMAEKSLAAVFIIQDGKFLFVNTSAIVYAGYSAEELVGYSSDIIVHPDDRELVKSKNREMLAGRSNQAFEFRIVTKQYQVRWISQMVAPIQYQGKPAILGNAMDITEKKRAEEALRERELFFSGTLNDMLTFVAVLEPGGDIIFVNNTPLKIAGMNLKDIIGKKFYDIYWWEYSDEAKQTIREDIEWASSGRIISHPIQIQTTEGLVWIEFSIHPIYDDEGKVKYIVPEGRDITDRKQAEDALRQSEELYKTLAEKSMAGIYVVQDGGFRFINSNAASYAGYTSEELLGQEVDLIVSPEDRDKARQNAEAMLLGEMSSPYELRITTKRGETRWIMETVTAISYEGRPAILGNSMDITDHKKMEEKILSLSVTDPLTGLYNRRGFLTIAEQQLKIAKRTKVGLLLLFADLDGMKWINDSLGHKKGDEALIEAASVLKKVFRESDIVARVGGDEFSVLAVGINKEDSRIIEDRLQYQIGVNNNRENRDYSLSMSVGMAYNDPENPSTIDELMSHADALMYEQKKGKRSG